MYLRTTANCCLLLALSGAAGYGQRNLADLEQTATKAHAEWFRLASDLEARVARMLPCASSATAAIEDTRRAATARILAVTNYVEAAAQQAGQDAAFVHQLQKAQTALAANHGAEALDTEQERADIEAQLKVLGESVRSKISLTTANNQLRSIENLARERVKLVASLSESNALLITQLGDLSAALEKREAALREQVGDLFEERGKWNSYYNARLARTRAECSAGGQ